MASTTRIGASGEKGDATVPSHPLRKMIRHKWRSKWRPRWRQSARKSAEAEAETARTLSNLGGMIAAAFASFRSHVRSCGWIDAKRREGAVHTYMYQMHRSSRLQISIGRRYNNENTRKVRLALLGSNLR